MHNNSVDWHWNQIFFSWIKKNVEKDKKDLYNIFAPTGEFNALPSDRRAFVDVCCCRCCWWIHILLFIYSFFISIHTQNIPSSHECRHSIGMCAPPLTVRVVFAQWFLCLTKCQLFAIEIFAKLAYHENTTLTYTHTPIHPNNNTNALIRCYAMFGEHDFSVKHFSMSSLPFSWCAVRCVVFRSNRIRRANRQIEIYLFGGKQFEGKIELNFPMEKRSRVHLITAQTSSRSIWWNTYRNQQSSKM